jgi:hypothetical protein
MSNLKRSVAVLTFWALSAVLEGCTTPSEKLNDVPGKRAMCVDFGSPGDNMLFRNIGAERKVRLCLKTDDRGVEGYTKPKELNSRSVFVSEGEYTQLDTDSCEELDILRKEFKSVLDVWTVIGACPNVEQRSTLKVERSGV